MKYNCLIVDDEKELGESTSEYFNLFNVVTAWVSSFDECLEFFETNETDLILLDINLGNESGFALCKKLREQTDVPILFISARQSDDDILLALGIGGDGYISKPFSLSVLLAKVKAVLKRYTSEERETFSFSDYLIDFTQERLYYKDNEIKLKSMEYKLLTYLILNRNKMITKQELFDNVWEDTITGDSTLNVHIRRLREKIEINPNEPTFIKTVWGKGYLFEDNKI